MATKVDLRERALRNIALISEGQAPTAYQASTMDEVIDEAQAWLEAEGIAYWSTDDIPEGVMFGLVDFVSGKAARRFFEADRAAQYSQLIEIGERALRKFTSTRGTERATRHRFF